MTPWARSSGERVLQTENPAPKQALIKVDASILYGDSCEVRFVWPRSPNELLWPAATGEPVCMLHAQPMYVKSYLTVLLTIR